MARYLLNENTLEIHKPPTEEQCNVDDARKAGHVRELTTRELVELMRGNEKASLCGHCMDGDEAD